MIHRNIEALDEADAKQLAGRPEYAIMQYVIERKIRLNLRLIRHISPDAHARHKGPVPGLHREAALLIINDFLDIGLLLHRTRAPQDNSTHKGQCGLRRFAIWSAMLQLAKSSKPKSCGRARNAVRRRISSRVSFSSPFCVRSQPALNRFSRVCRLRSSESAGCWVVFRRGLASDPSALYRRRPEQPWRSPLRLTPRW